MINNILREYLNDFVIIYLNNILIYLFILKKYMKYIKKYWNVWINKIYESKKKCVFYREKIDFLKYVVKKNEIYIDLIKFQIIKN